MEYSEALAAVVAQGAIRICELSKGWHMVYRVQNGELEVRSLIKSAFADEDAGTPAQWTVSDHMAGSDEVKSADGWFPVEQTHPQVKPIELAAAKQNPGYWSGLTQRCETCKEVKPASVFERDMTAEGGRRTWECNECAAERVVEVAKNQPDRHGDVLKRDTHASQPPVESEI